MATSLHRGCCVRCPRDLRNHYGDLLARAEAGDQVDIVRDGKVIATLGPPSRPAGTPRGRIVDIFATSEAVDPDQFFDDLYGSDGLDGGFGAGRGTTESTG